MTISSHALGARGDLLDEMGGVIIRTAKNSNGIAIVVIEKH